MSATSDEDGRHGGRGEPGTAANALMKHRTLIPLVAFVLVFAAPAGAQHGGIGTPLLSTPLITTLNQQAAKIAQARAVRCLSPPVFRWHPGGRVPAHMRPLVIEQRRVRLAKVRRMASRCAPWYVTRQIEVAEAIGPLHDDAWPNCPDPFDSRSYTWIDTVKCENKRYWQLYGYPRAFLDSPGFYRCGLQFHPNWETRFGRLCP